jgi:60 kDa SS-A/Ro ribonucleoprotein
MRYNNVFNPDKTPQSLPIPGSTQVANSAGGYAWGVDDWTRLSRFLVLGSEGGSYYASEVKLTQENAHGVLRCIQADGLRTVREIVAVSDAGRAPRNDPALFALAMCAAFGNDPTRRAALEALPKVARIGTHLFHFAEYVHGMRGWGRGLREGVARWYEGQDAAALANQVVKYRQRDGWSHRDLLRLAHPKTEDTVRNAIYHWVVDGWESVGAAPHPDAVLRTLWAFERVQRSTDAVEITALVREYQLPIEAVPTEKRGRAVWEAVLPHAGLTFLIRNLVNLSRVGILRKGSWDEVEAIRARLTDPAQLKRARIHPIQLLSALTVYRQGTSARGGEPWEVAPQIVEALDQAFYLSFGNVEKAGGRWVLALDVSGSMSMGQVAGVPGLTPRTASAAMAMVTYKVEPQVEVVAFCDKMTPLSLARHQSLDAVLKATDNLAFGGTDCSLPMRWALKNRVQADTFVVYTDNETWFGGVHPSQALRDYRQKTGIAAQLIVVGMVSNGFTIADPNDTGMLDVVGFDTSAPEVMRQFAAKRL